MIDVLDSNINTAFELNFWWWESSLIEC